MIGNWINTMFQTIMLWIDSVVYWFAAQIYELFIRLATIQLFSDSFFQNFASRIYSILGVFMLFYLAYALLNAIIDPDKLAKGDKSVSKIASNLVVSLVILGLLPSIFSYAYRLQNYILASNTIGAIIFGGETVDPSSGEENDTMLQYGNYLSFSVLNTFLNPDNYNVRIDANPDTSWINVREDIIDRGEYGGLTGLSEAIVYGAPDLNDGNQEKYVTYRVVLSTLAGVYLCYVLISFTLDLGVRVVKFAFCQLIAPIPVIMRIVPGKKGTFDKWMKLTLTVYFEVFIRVAFMYLSIYLISEIARTNVLGEVFSGGIQGMLAFAIIILGILTFAKQAPKMLCDMLGLDSGSLKLGIGEKLKAGGFFKGAAIAGVGGAMLGAGATGFVRNGIKGVGTIKTNMTNANGFGNKAKALGFGTMGTIASTVAGTTSGMINAYTNPKNIKNVSDVKKQATTGAQKSWENKKQRENYVAVNNGIVGSAKAKFTETVSTVKEWSTGSGLSAGILAKIKFRDNIKKTYDDSYKSLFETPDYKNMDTLLNDYKAKKNAGVNTVDGQEINSAIASLEQKMNQSRYDTIHNKTTAVAYAAYSIAQQMKEDPKGTMEANFTLNGINPNDLYIKGNEVYNKQTNSPLTEADLRKIFEGVDMNGNIINANGKPIAGVKKQISTLQTQNVQLKQSVEYKELQRKEAASEKKK